MSRLRHLFGTLRLHPFLMVLWLVPYLWFGALGEAGHTHLLPHADHVHTVHYVGDSDEGTATDDAGCLLCQWHNQSQTTALSISFAAPVLTEFTYSYYAVPATLATRSVEIGSARGPPSLSLI